MVTNKFFTSGLREDTFTFSQSIIFTTNPDGGSFKDSKSIFAVYGAEKPSHMARGFFSSDSRFYYVVYGKDEDGSYQERSHVYDMATGKVVMSNDQGRIPHAQLRTLGPNQ